LIYCLRWKKTTMCWRQPQDMPKENPKVNMDLRNSQWRRILEPVPREVVRRFMNSDVVLYVQYGHGEKKGNLIQFGWACQSVPWLF
jgi:hypothetical protein